MIFTEPAPPVDLGKPEMRATDEWIQRLPWEAFDPCSALIFRVNVNGTEYIYKRIAYDEKHHSWRCRWVD